MKIWSPGFFVSSERSITTYHTLVYLAPKKRVQFTHPWLATQSLAWAGYLVCSQGLDNKAVGRMRMDVLMCICMFDVQ